MFKFHLWNLIFLIPKQFERSNVIFASSAVVEIANVAHAGWMWHITKLTWLAFFVMTDEWKYDI
jgi:hypothetical protein